MTEKKQLRHVVRFTAILAVAALSTTVLLDIPTAGSSSNDWFTALGILLLLTIVSQLLALRITEGGSTTTMDFVPHLGAVLLIGPSGAAILTTLSDLLFEFKLLKNPPRKALFNTSQLVISVILASWIFIALGGEPIATPHALDIDYSSYIVPFLAAVLVYFAINTTSVAYVISLAQEAAFRDVWSWISGRLILFDIAISPLAFFVAFLYWRFDWYAPLLVIIPIIGLRYSYGVNLELQQLNTDLARVLIRTIESQDPYTGGHSLRVSRWAREIADAAQVGYREKRNIETAALLHDIGKIDRIYFEILRQKGPLTPKQREAIRAHPERGVNMLSPVRSLDEDVLAYIKHHHEHYNGRGYPDGISGEDIPIGARIIMIADTVDAMMTRRPYRDALPPEVVRDELQNQKGDQFDPELVELVLSTGIFDVMTQSYSEDDQEDSRDGDDLAGQRFGIG